MLQDAQYVGQRLNVVHKRRTPEQAGLGRIRRLVAGLPAEALDRIEEGCLFAANVRSGAAPDLNRACPLEQARGLQLGDSRAHALGRVRILSPDVDVGPLRTRRERGDHDRFDDREWVALHQHAVFEGARLGFVRVANDVLGTTGVGHRAPLAPGRKRSPAATDQIGPLDLFNHPFRTLL